jgi:hypothetical protein
MVDGRLDAEVVGELERVVAGLSGPLRVSLAGLRSADEAGIEALRCLRTRGIALTGASPYLRLRLGVKWRGKAREPPAPPGEPRRERGARPSRHRRKNGRRQ